MTSGISVAACLAILAAFFPPAPAAADTEAAKPRVSLTVALPDGISPRTIGYYLAQQKGYFDKAGLAIRFATPGEANPGEANPGEANPGEGRTAIESLGAGKASNRADLAVATMPVALRAREHGLKAVHVAQIFRFSGMELICRPVVDQPDALKDRAVSVVFGGLESAFYGWMEALDLNPFGGPGGVTVLRQNNGLDSFMRYQVDCATTFTYAAPLEFAAAGSAPQGMHVYRYQELGQATLEDGLYAREADLHKPDRVAAFTAFLAAARKGWQLLHDDTKSAVDLLHADPGYAKLDTAMLKQALDAVDELVAPEKGPIGKLDPDAYDRTVNLLLTAAPDPVLTRAPARAISGALWPKPQ
jgi:NitT/TauT family transport system substrate-binding protein